MSPPCLRFHLVACSPLHVQYGGFRLVSVLCKFRNCLPHRARLEAVVWMAACLTCSPFKFHMGLTSPGFFLLRMTYFK